MANAATFADDLIRLSEAARIAGVARTTLVQALLAGRLTGFCAYCGLGLPLAVIRRTRWHRCKLWPPGMEADPLVLVRQGDAARYECDPWKVRTSQKGLPQASRPPRRPKGARALRWWGSTQPQSVRN